MMGLRAALVEKLSRTPKEVQTNTSQSLTGQMPKGNDNG